VTSEPVAPEFERYVDQQRRAGALAPAPVALQTGEITETVHVDPRSADRLLTAAAYRAAGIFYSTRRTTIAWVEGDQQLAVNVVEMHLELADGLIVVVIPVRCDQTGSVEVRVTFVVGTHERPAGLYAATETRPRGPKLIVDAWGDALVAFAWQCLLGLVSGLAGAVGKDYRGNILIPVELAANADGIFVVPMARHRFSGASGLTVTRPVVTGPGPVVTGPTGPSPTGPSPTGPGPVITHRGDDS
jgi:hypothetical protein